MTDDKAHNKAQKIIDEALVRIPRDHKINNTDISYARRVIDFVFADGYNIPAEETKKSFFRQLDSKALMALAVLIRVRDIQGNSVSTIESLCKNSSFISTTRWYNDPDLWTAALSVVSDSAVYLKFRKDAVHAIKQAKSPYQPTPAQPTLALPFKDPDVKPGSTEATTCTSCGRWLQKGVAAYNPETASAVSGDPFKPCPSASAPPNTRSPPAPAASADGPAPAHSADAAPTDAADTLAKPSHTGGSYAHVLGKRRKLQDTPSATFRVPCTSSDFSAAPPYPRLGQPSTLQQGNRYSIDSAASHPLTTLSTANMQPKRNVIYSLSGPWTDMLEKAFPGVRLFHDLAKSKEKFEDGRGFSRIANFHFFSDMVTEVEICLDTADEQSCLDAANQVDAILRRAAPGASVEVRQVRQMRIEIKQYHPFCQSIPQIFSGR
ncbi:hypothetical protein N656DRAFT_785658 [Canariomyces notabilis]|uniref:Uncharacterized protein n=1 Tax=Canariomyces notabilis TaxID=2074819 RepID=A0AAN6T7T2_9PEZI|nr:hypothetical protein N656DRAFT_785658 [Canariomyces arenarius]